MPVVGAVVVLREDRVPRVLARQQAGGERNAGDDAHAGLTGGREHLAQGLHAERVEDDLHARHARPGDRGQRLLAGLDADAVRGDPLLLDQGVEGVEHLVRGVDGRRRAVQLHQVDAVDAEVAPGAVVPGAEVLQHVVLGDLLDPAAHLGGDQDVQVRPAGEERGDGLLAAAVAVDVGGVEEGHPGLGRRLQYREGFLVVDVSPVGPQLPRTETDDGSVLTRPVECALVHGRQSVIRHGPARRVLLRPADPTEFTHTSE